jgi:hypothetical protein
MIAITIAIQAKIAAVPMIDDFNYINGFYEISLQI